jgi:hypothetical protein
VSERAVRVRPTEVVAAGRHPGRRLDGRAGPAVPAVPPRHVPARVDSPLGNVVVVATLLLLVVAGLTVGVRLAASIPAVVVDGRSWRHALSRSWSLVNGHRGHALATLVLAFVAISLVGTLISVLTGTLASMLAGDGWLARTLVQAAVNALTLSYFLTVWVLLYLDLRARKEPLGLDTLRADLRMG